MYQESPMKVITQCDLYFGKVFESSAVSKCSDVYLSVLSTSQTIRKAGIQQCTWKTTVGLQSFSSTPQLQSLNSSLPDTRHHTFLCLQHVFKQIYNFQKGEHPSSTLSNTKNILKDNALLACSTQKSMTTADLKG